MYITLTVTEIADRLVEKGWERFPALTLAEYLDDNFPDVEFDAIAIYLDYTFFKNLEEWAEDYNPSLLDLYREGKITQDEFVESAREELDEKTFYLSVNDPDNPHGIIIQNY